MLAWVLPAKQIEFFVPCIELHRLQEEHQKGERRIFMLNQV